MGDHLKSCARGLLRTFDFLRRFLVRFAGRRRPDRLAGVIRFGLGSVLDFLVEDGCALCRRPHDARRAWGPAVAEPVRYLLEPVSVGCLFGVLKAVNHPVCAGCADGLVVAHSIGVLGKIIGADGIETTLGEKFGGSWDAALAACATRRGGGSGEASLPGGPLLWSPHTGSGEASSREELFLPSPDGETINIVAPFMTTDAALKIIHLLKFGGYLDLALPIARSMGWAIRWSGVEHDGAAILVPTPMDRRSEKRRGFNHAERIARELAIDLGLPVAAGVLHKKTGTQRQSKTKHEHRARNVRSAFWCPAPSTPQLAGKAAILVDDLVTTGATAAACGAALLGGGARSVTVVCFGRAL